MLETVDGYELKPVGDEVARMDHLLKAGHPNEWRALTAPSS
ncbi:MAG: hypothetical protein Q8K45_09765 [Rubrivivax sp.]|nr:hypothetical protein [Rubrivivax sp.]